MFEWAYSGVNSSVPGDGGADCAEFLTPTRRFFETIVASLFASLLIIWGYRNLSESEAKAYVRRDRGGKRLLLILMSLIWGMEIGFKLASQTLIYLLNPCHVTTAIQIYLLAAPPSKRVSYVFRTHLNFLNGAVLAFLFPVTHSRILPFETSIYWIQHSMMMVVPYYLLRLGGVYNVEKLSDFSWCSLSYGLNLIYHFGLLQAVALPTEVNLNNMLCPAPSDPFAGPYYRVCAMIHQFALCPLTCKAYCWVSAFFLTKFGPTRVKKDLSSDVTLSCMQNSENHTPSIQHPEVNNISSQEHHSHVD